VGKKLSPVPVEYAFSTPLCTPLADPRTRTEATVILAALKKLI
jgi:hypothetical protein